MFLSTGHKCDIFASTENLIIYLNLSKRFEERGLGGILSKVETALPYID